MAAPNPQTAEGIREKRLEERKQGEPLNTERRKVQDYGGCLYINLTAYGVQTLGIDTRDKVVVESYPDRVVVRKNQSDE